jgi:hypothetical protein
MGNRKSKEIQNHPTQIVSSNVANNNNNNPNNNNNNNNNNKPQSPNNNNNNQINKPQSPTKTFKSNNIQVILADLNEENKKEDGEGFKFNISQESIEYFSKLSKHECNNSFHSIYSIK